MTALVRIEYVRPRRAGDAYGVSPQVTQHVPRTATPELEFVQAETLIVGPASISTSVAPAFEPDRSLEGGVFARVSVLKGAVVVMPPSEDVPAPTATETAGVRMELGDLAQLFPIEQGQRLAFIESTRQPRNGARYAMLTNANASGPLITDIVNGYYLWTIQGALNGATAVLQVLGPDKTNYIDLLSTNVAPRRMGLVLGEGDSARVLLNGGAPAGVFSELI